MVICVLRARFHAAFVCKNVVQHLKISIISAGSRAIQCFHRIMTFEPYVVYGSEQRQQHTQCSRATEMIEHRYAPHPNMNVNRMSCRVNVSLICLMLHIMTFRAIHVAYVSFVSSFVPVEWVPRATVESDGLIPKRKNSMNAHWHEGA